MLLLWPAEDGCCLQCMARSSDKVFASLARAGPVRSLVRLLEPAPDEVKLPLLPHLQCLEAS